MRYVVVTSEQKFMAVPEFHVRPGEQRTRRIFHLGGYIDVPARPEPATFYGTIPLSAGVNTGDFYVLGEDGVLHRCMGTNFSFSLGAAHMSGHVLTSQALENPGQYATIVAQVHGEQRK